MSTLTKIDTIFVATDSSEPKIGWAAQIAQAHGAKVVLYHGISPARAAEPTSDALLELDRHTALSELEEKAADLRRRGIEVELNVQFDLGPSTILQRSAAHDASLIIVGHSCGERTRTVLLGGTVARLIRDATVPVLAVPTNAGNTRPIRRVLIPTDFAGDVQSTLHSVEALLGAGAADTEVTLLHVHPTAYEPASPWSAPLVVGPRAAHSAVQKLEEITRRLDHHVRRIHTVACGGDPACAIDREAQHLNADLIVIAHGHAGIARRLRHGTAQRVLGAAPCPVLTIRKDPKPRAKWAWRTPRDAGLRQLEARSMG